LSQIFDLSPYDRYRTFPIISLDTGGGHINRDFNADIRIDSVGVRFGIPFFSFKVAYVR